MVMVETDDAGREATVATLPFVFLGCWPHNHKDGALPPSTGHISPSMTSRLKRVVGQV